MNIPITILTLMTMQYINVPYKWAGNGPYDFDCSGLVIKVLHDIGYTLPDMKAQDIYKWAIKKEFYSCNPEEDCLLFFGKSEEKITHIGIAIDQHYMIEAGGSGRESLKMTKEQLALKDARVRIKKITNRRDLVSSIKISYVEDLWKY